MSNLEKFENLGLSEKSLLAISKKGFEEPSPIQKLTIPLLLKNEKDIVGQAQTGTGKTAAFGLPIMDNITENTGKVQALVLAPTRELAVQVAEEMNSYRGGRSIGILPVYGGQSYDQQFRRLKKGVEIVVGTPGRLIDHLNRGTLKLDDLQFMVLDEADEMLNMGFIEDIELILSKTPEEKRVLLFSATMPQRIVQLAEKFMGEYELIKVQSEQLTVNLTDQIYFEVRTSDKFEALCRIIDVEKEFYALVFCRTKLKTDHLANALIDRGYDVASLHGDISQAQRERILSQFKKKRVTILVATDVAARGIDINNLTHVLNYSLPQDPESYIHRIGRTGRAGKQGTAITFITPSEYRKLMNIQRISKSEIRKESLPKVKQLIKLKRKRIVEKINEIIVAGKFDENMHVSNELLAQYPADQVIAALLTHAYKDEFSPEKYTEIHEPGKKHKTTSRRHPDNSPDQEGITRLFIALGRKDKIDPPKLVKLIQEEAMVDSHLIRNVEIYDNFSFANVPFEEAEHIIEVFRGKGRNKKPLIVEAKGKEKSSPKRNFRSGTPHKNYDKKSGSDKSHKKRRH
ncbi:MAG: DEAD/DEAH box helicase [Candidatus Tenebribacter burtonii]|jgi:ATP-dependent RNA helicase DeaD|nr:DEAD/DEAH box helicase [Candidatus Tenebribacter burtonii]